MNHSKKNNIGILTFHYANNYGAVLQSFALYTTIKKLGFIPTIINRVPNKSNREVKLFTRDIHNILNKYFGTSFSLFRKQYFKSITKLIDSDKKMNEICNLFDTIIVGSDQVWRLKYTQGFGYNYFLDFATQSVNKISYAASFGVDEFEGNENQSEIVKELLKRFSAVSVREDSAINICKKHFNINSTHVLDPTLLLATSDYEKIICSNKIISNNSLAYFFLDNNSNKKKIVHDLSVNLNLNLKNIYRKSEKSFTLRKPDLHLSKYKYPQVGLWLTNLKSAKFVVTDSFHGVALSILFNKQFICIGNKERGLTRIISLLKIFDLEDRLISEKDDCLLKSLDLIDYVKVNEILEIKRRESIFFLQNSITI